MSSPSAIYLIRHGETEWARLGRHTGRTDIPLTTLGREQAGLLGPLFEGLTFDLVLTSPLQRAHETARLAGFAGRAEISDDLLEWDYGTYEGLTTEQIRRQVPDWTVWTHPSPQGESIAQVTRRAEAVVRRVEAVAGNVAIFAHGHFLRVLLARWLGLGAEEGRHFLLDTSTLSILGYDRGERVVKTWNGPLLTAACEVPRKPAAPA